MDNQEFGPLDGFGGQYLINIFPQYPKRALKGSLGPSTNSRFHFGPYLLAGSLHSQWVSLSVPEGRIRKQRWEERKGKIRKFGCRKSHLSQFSQMVKNMGPRLLELASAPRCSQGAGSRNLAFAFFDIWYLYARFIQFNMLINLLTKLAPVRQRRVRRRRHWPLR